MLIDAKSTCNVRLLVLRVHMMMFVKTCISGAQLMVQVNGDQPPTQGGRSCAGIHMICLKKKYKQIFTHVCFVMGGE